MTFTQGKLQDYADCARRFQLRYLAEQPSPALIVDSPLELERLVQRGADFHRLVHQHLLGLDDALLAASIEDPQLAEWWRTYLTHPPAGLPQAVVRPEIVLAAPLPVPGIGTARLVARFDLLAADPGRRLVIVDWKTVARLPSRRRLEERLQTRVYRYLAVEAGAALNGGRHPEPEQVEMVYWFAAHGGRSERFAYDAEQHAAGREVLAGLVAEIADRAERGEPIWPLTPDREQCRFCNYRSLCERGVKAGRLENMEDDLESLDIEIDLEQVAEVEF
jgi:hypothetical protein